MNILQYLKPIVYVRLSPTMLSVRDVGARRELSEPPVAAISRGESRKLLAIGVDAKAVREPADVINPFTHPRALLSDYTLAELIVKGMVRKLFSGRWYVPAPRIVMHPKVNPEGGFTQIEIRALQELGRGAGASRAVVWEGRDLQDDELLSLKFGPGGRVLS